MLGYIVSKKSELKVREAEIYRAYYCGVCKAIGKKYGQFPRLVLSYDSAFLAILMDSLSDENENLKRQVCISNPLRKKNIAFSKGIDFSADMMLCLSWFKILDDIEDDNSKLAKSLRYLYRGSFKRIESKYESLVKEISVHIDRLKVLEKNGCENLDEVADCFAQIMKSIFQGGYVNLYQNKKNHINFEALGQLGYHMGRWVYLVDALDDLQDNIEKGGFNPIVKRFEYKNEGFDVFKEAIKPQMEKTLILSLSMASKALDLLDIKKNKEILENIIFVGMLEKTINIVNK